MRTTKVFWPSFLFAVLGTVVLFSILDPVDLRFVGPLELDREAGFVIAFFLFWGLAAGSSWLTSRLTRRKRRAPA